MIITDFDFTSVSSQNRPQTVRAYSSYLQEPNLCLHCQAVLYPPIVVKPHQLLYTRKRRFCNSSHSAIYNNQQRPRSKPLRVNRKELRDQAILRREKSTLGRTTISSHARLVLKNTPRVCSHCAYSKFVEACHIRSVSDFPLTALLAEINSIDNLMWLCPNCHWEFDHGL